MKNLFYSILLFSLSSCIHKTENFKTDIDNKLKIDLGWNTNFIEDTSFIIVPSYICPNCIKSDMDSFLMLSPKVDFIVVNRANWLKYRELSVPIFFDSINVLGSLLEKHQVNSPLYIEYRHGVIRIDSL